MAEGSEGRPRRRRAAKPVKYERRYAPEIVADLTALGETDPGLVDAALAAIEDLAFGRQRGKLLGDRHVTGDLTGCGSTYPTSIRRDSGSCIGSSTTTP